MAKLVSTTQKTTIGGAIEEAFSEIESLRDEMTEWRDNMEERLSHTEKYERVSECADALDNVREIDVPDSLRDVPVEIVHQRKASKKSPYPRWVRLQNASNALEAVKWMIEEKEDPTDEEEQLASDIGDVVDELSGVEFPGMFG